MLTTMTVKLYPSRSQAETLSRYLAAGRRVYNHFLEHRIKIYRRRRESTSLYSQNLMLTKWRRDCERMRCIPVAVQRDAIRRLDRSYKGFFRRLKSGNGKPGFPRFKGRYYWHSCQFLEKANYAVDGKIRVPKLGLIRCRNLRPITSAQKLLRIVRRAKGWFAQIVIDDGLPFPANRPVREAVGLDVGLSLFTCDSNGTAVEAPQFFRKAQRRLAMLQRRVSRKRKGSRRRAAAIHRLRRMHERVADARSDFTHKMSKFYVTRFDLIAVEKLNVTGMIRGRYGKSINDAAWSQFTRRLSYKAAKAGATFVEVDPRGTSQECSQCGEKVQKSLSVRLHQCSCGCRLNRDHNAAIVILNRGLQIVSSMAGRAKTNGRGDSSAGGDAVSSRHGSQKRQVLVLGRYL